MNSNNANYSSFKSKNINDPFSNCSSNSLNNNNQHTGSDSNMFLEYSGNFNIINNILNKNNIDESEIYNKFYNID